MVGSIASSVYAASAPATGGESLGAAIEVSDAVARAAQEAFVNAMSTASLIVAVVAALGALIAWRHLPSAAIRPGRA